MYIRSLLSYLLLFWLVDHIGCTELQHANQIPHRDYALKDYFTVELLKKQDLEEFKSNFPNFHFEHEFRGLDNHYVFSVPKEHNSTPENKIYGINDQEYEHHDAQLLRKRDASILHKRMASDATIRSLHLLEPRQLAKRAPIPEEAYDSSLEPVFAAKKKYNINDPEFLKQWHIINTVSPGNDVNVTGVWDLGITGNNITVAIIDDGLDFTSKDLKDAFNKEGSWDYNANRNEPMPTLDDDYHGTRCAGEIAARKNDFCGIGVATGSKVAGLRILSGKITAEDEAAALMYRSDVNDIYSCSWGPPDDGKSMQAPPLLVKKSMVKGILDGRSGKGSLYVFASGNGGFHGDTCNFDGYTNSIYSITVGAVDWKGNHPAYAEACSAVLTVTYSSGSGEHIHTTDIKEQCSNHHGGTSAAAPLAAGIYALVLEANKDLTWRDVQYITILSGVEINENDGDWQDSAMGKKYSHKYGYGKIDAYKMVEMAKNWKNVKPQAWHYSDLSHPNKDIDEINTPVLDSIKIEKNKLKQSNFEKVEHITVTVDLDATIRGQVSMNLISPTGRRSRLAMSRPLDQANEGFKNWTFMTVAHWAEDGDGEYKIEVINHDKNNKVRFNSWQLKLFGVSIDPKKAKRFPLPGEEPKDDDKEADKTPEKPSTTETPAATATPDSDADNHEDEDGKFKHRITKHYGEYFFLLIVIGFCICLFYLRAVSKRRPHRRRAEDYEFDIINPESDDESRLSSASPRFDYDSDNESLNIESGNRPNSQDHNRATHNVGDFEIDSDDETEALQSDTKHQKLQQQLLHI